MIFAITGFGVESATRLRFPPELWAPAARAAAGPTPPRAARPSPATPRLRIDARSYVVVKVWSFRLILSTGLVGLVDLYMSNAHDANKNLLFGDRARTGLSPGYNGWRWLSPFRHRVGSAPGSRSSVHTRRS